MASNTGLILGLVVGLVLLIVFLPRLKSLNLGNIFGGGAQTSESITQTSNGGSSKTSVKSVNGNVDIDVEGNGCACANGICEGNCSDMEQIDLDNFDPLEWVEQHT